MPTIGNLGTMFVRDENGKLVPVPCIQGKNGITPHIGANGNWWIGETDTGAMADNKKYPVKAAVYEAIFMDKPPEYTLEILLEDGERIRTELPHMGLTPDDVVEIGSGEPSEWDDINYKQFYVDKNTGRLYINTSKGYPNSYITLGGGVQSGETDPTGEEAASINDLYINTKTGAIFLCVRMESFMPSEPPYPVWQQIGGTGGSGGVTEETDPTVPSWAKQAQKPTYTASEVGARPDTWMPTAAEIGALPASTKIPGKTSDLTNDSGYITIAVATLLNYYLKTETYAKTETYSQTEVDNLISGLDKRLNAIADSEDVDLDQLSEIVAYIKANKSLIDSITTSKVNVSDIVDNLTTADSKKPLSAAQGKALKALYDALPAWAKAASKPTYTKSEVGLGNVDNVRQYSADNPPPYPVTSVNGQTGAVKLGASDVGALPDDTKIPGVDDTLKVSGAAADAKVVGEKFTEVSEAIADQQTQLDGKQPKGNYITEIPAEYVTEDELDAEITDLKAQGVQQVPLFANDISECTDTTKPYVLPDGYIYAYVKTTITTEGETVPNFTNLLDDPNAYTKPDLRYSQSSGTWKDNSGGTSYVIPIPKGNVTLRIKNYHWHNYNHLYAGTTNTVFDGSLGDTSTGSAFLAALQEKDKLITLNFTNDQYDYATFVSKTGYVEIVTANEEITYTTTEGGTVTSYQWANTGHAFVPADYEDRILGLESGLADAENDINLLKGKMEGLSVSNNATTAFSIPAYCPVPQLPADGSEGSDFNANTMSTQNAYDYMDALSEKYTNYMYKQTMGKDASGIYDHNRYILSKAYWRAWQKTNYLKMYAWKNGGTVIYSVSVSPRVGENMYSTPYIGTVYKAVTSVNCTAGILSTRTVNGLVFERYADGDIEPTIVYTKVPRYPNDFASATVYNSSFGSLTKVKTVGDDSFVGTDGVTYIRYPFEDRSKNKTKPLSIFILSNEHGYHGDAAIPSFALMRMAKDLCKNTENPFLKWLKENCMITMIPVGNPWGYGRHLDGNGNGYYNSNGININRNYDTPGWATSDTNYGDVETFGAYAGSEIETQHIMNTMQLCKPSVGISMHGLELPDEYKNLPDNGYFIHQGCGYDSNRIIGIAETLYSAYNLAADGDIEQANSSNNCGKSPAYIQYVGAVGGLTETICWESGTNNVYTAVAMEQAYTQMLLFLQTWCEEALENQQ